MNVHTSFSRKNKTSNSMFTFISKKQRTSTEAYWQTRTQRFLETKDREKEEQE